MDTTVALLTAESADDHGMAAATSLGPRDTNRVVELYDSGTTHHLSPYRDRFITFRPIPPKGFDAANQQSFSATGVGDMMVEVPNGTDTSQIRLTEVLYSPEVGYTLVSIGRIDDAGCTTTFANGRCTITAPTGRLLGQIPKNARGHDGTSSPYGAYCTRSCSQTHHQRFRHWIDPDRVPGWLEHILRVMCHSKIETPTRC